MLKCHNFIALNVSVDQRGQDIIVKYVQAEENTMEQKFLLSSSASLVFLGKKRQVLCSQHILFIQLFC